MSDNTRKVVSIDGVDRPTVADCVPIQDDLADWIRAINEGESKARRGIFVYQTHSGHIYVRAVGDALSKLESCGLLAWGIEEIKRGPNDG